MYTLNNTPLPASNGKGSSTFMRIIGIAIIAILFASSAFAQSKFPDKLTLSNYFPSPSFQLSTSGTVPDKFILGWSIGDEPSGALTNGMEMNARLGSPVENLAYGSLDYTHYLSAPILASSNTASLFSTTGTQRGDAHEGNNPLLGFGIRYDPTAMWRIKSRAVTSDGYQETYPTAGDPEGGAFGFLTVNGSKVINPSTGSYELLVPTTQSLVLKDPWPNDEFFWFREGKVNSDAMRNQLSQLPKFRIEHIRSETNTQILRVAIQVRRVAGINTDLNTPVLRIKVPYSQKLGYGKIDDFSDKQYIKFSRVSKNTRTVHTLTSTLPPYNRGYEGELEDVTQETTTFVITAGMLQDHDEYVTYSAEFRMLGTNPEDDYDLSIVKTFMKNPQIRSIYDQSLQTIKRLGLEVEYVQNSGVQVAIDWVQLATPTGEDIYKGKKDNLISDWLHNTREKYLQRLNGNSVGIYRLWLIEEDYPRSYFTNGYLNRLYGNIGTMETFMFSVYDHRNFDNITGSALLRSPLYYADHIRHECGMPDWWFNNSIGQSSVHAAPYIAKGFTDDGSSPVDRDRKSVNIGLHKGVLSGQQTNRSEYEITAFGYTDLMTMKSSNSYYNQYTNYSEAPMAYTEGVMRNLATARNEIFSGKRWYMNLWPYSEWGLHKTDNANGEFLIGRIKHGEEIGKTQDYIVARMSGRPKTGEEVRASIWSSLILGAKGLYYFTGPKAMGTSYREKSDFVNPYVLWENPLQTDVPWAAVTAMVGMRSTMQGELRYYLGSSSPNQTVNSLTYSGSKRDFIKSPSLGRDFISLTSNQSYGDDTFLDKFMDRLNNVGSYHGVPENRVYLGRMSMRRSVFEEHSKIRGKNHELGNVLKNTNLKVWYSHGMRPEVYFKDNTAEFQSLVDYTKIQTRPVEYKPLEFESADSSFYDVTLLKNDDNPDIFYLGVFNRRTDPLIVINQNDSSVVSGTRYSTTASWMPAGKELRFLTTSEFLEEVEQGDLDKYSQLGSREIHIPIRGHLFPTDQSKFYYWNVTELGTYNRFTVYGGQNIIDKFMPGEGKIYKLERKEYQPQELLGDLSFPNQTKFVVLPELITQSQQRFRYYLVYHKDGEGGRRDVFYRRSAQHDKFDQFTELAWEDETQLDYEIIRDGQPPITGIDCAYPSIVVRKDGGVSRAYIVYTCRDNPENLEDWYVVESELPADVASPTLWNGREIYRPLNPTPGNMNEGWGATTINASADGNFYAFGEKGVGIRAAYKPLGTLSLIGMTSFTFSGSSEAKHPALNSYSRYALGENDCAVVWQELMNHNGVLGWHVPYTRLRYNAFLGQVQSYLYDVGVLLHGGGGTRPHVVNTAGTMILASDEASSAQSYTFPNLYRGVEGAGTIIGGVTTQALIRAQWDRVTMNAEGTPPLYGGIAKDKQIRIKVFDIGDKENPLDPTNFWANDLQKVFSTTYDLWGADVSQGQALTQYGSFSNLSKHAVTFSFIGGNSVGSAQSRFLLFAPYWGWSTYNQYYPSNEDNSTSKLVWDLARNVHLARRSSLEQQFETNQDRALTRVVMNKRSNNTIFESPEYFLREDGKPEAKSVFTLQAKDGKKFSLIGSPKDITVYKNELVVSIPSWESMLVDSITAISVADSVSWQLNSSYEENRIALSLVPNGLLVELVLVRLSDGFEEVVPWSTQAMDSVQNVTLQINKEIGEEWVLRVRSLDTLPALLHEDLLLSDSEPEGFTRITDDQSVLHINLKNQENVLSGDINITPNPVSDRMWVKLPNVSGAQWEIRVFDMTGREVLFAKNIASEHSFDVSKLPSASYILKATVDGTTYSKAFVVVK